MKRYSPSASRRVRPIVELLEERRAPVLFPSVIFLEDLTDQRPRFRARWL